MDTERETRNSNKWKKNECGWLGLGVEDCRGTRYLSSPPRQKHPGPHMMGRVLLWGGHGGIGGQVTLTVSVRNMKLFEDATYVVRHTQKIIHLKLGLKLLSVRGDGGGGEDIDYQCQKAWKHTHTHTHTHTHIHRHTDTQTHRHIYTHTHTHTPAQTSTQQKYSETSSSSSELRWRLLQHRRQHVGDQKRPTLPVENEDKEVGQHHHAHDDAIDDKLVA